MGILGLSIACLVVRPPVLMTVNHFAAVKARDLKLN